MVLKHPFQNSKIFVLECSTTKERPATCRTAESAAARSCCVTSSVVIREASVVKKTSQLVMNVFEILVN